MPQIELSNGQAALVDADDYERVKNFTWTISPIGNTRYLMNRKMVKGKSTCIFIHRMLLSAEPHQLVDHINGDGLDNRRCNLRIANKAQNSMNSKKRSDNTSGFRGVAFVPKANRYQAKLHFEGRRITSRFCKTAIEAAEAYKSLAIKHYGDFVRLENGGLV